MSLSGKQQLTSPPEGRSSQSCALLDYRRSLWYWARVCWFDDQRYGTQEEVIIKYIRRGALVVYANDCM